MLASVVQASEVNVPLLVSLVELGMTSGELPACLGHVSRCFELRVEEKINRWSAIADPVLLLFSGLLTGSIVALVMIPVFSSISHVF